MTNINKRHEGEAIYIIGGGASLTGFDFSKLDGKITIACNRAIQFFTPTYMVYMDDQFYEWYEDDIKAFDGLKFSHSWNKYRDNVIFANNLGPLGLSEDFKEGLMHGGNAAFLALNLAYVMGGDPIYILGVDMCYSDERTHFHDGYPKEDTIGEKRFDHMIRAFDYASGIFDERGVKVYNCSGISKLECFEKMDLRGL
jgi:hypothetical protein